MALVQNILLVISLFILMFLAIFILSRVNLPGAKALFVMILSIIVWTIGSSLETLSSTLPSLLFWRNFQQIGVFMTPLSTLYFSVEYTMNRHMRKFAHFAAVVGATSLLLIFTDSIHHIMRKSVQVQQSDMFGNVLVVHSTPIGSLLVAFNFSLAAIAVLVLLFFVRKVSPGLRRPLWLVILSIALTFVITLLKAAILEKIGIYLQMSVLYAPCVVLFCYTLIKSNFLGISPIARNKVFDVIDQGILVLDANGTVLDHNSQAAPLLKQICGAKDLKIGALIQDLLPVKQWNSRQENSENGRAEIEFKKALGEGTISVKQHLLGGHNNAPLGYVLILTDITAQKDYERQLKERAETDALTGVYNREGLKTAYARLQIELCEEDLPISVFMMDIDHFKNINDAFGHQTGDCVLKDLTKVMRTILHREDIIGRIGGDEFVAILPHIGREDAYFIAEKLRKRSERSSVFHGDQQVRYTVSIGVTDCDEPDKDFDGFLYGADLALYQAKFKNRNNTAIYPFTPELFTDVFELET